MRTITHKFENICEPIEYKIGTNASENFKILDLADIDDIWFHADESSSCHVIARVPKDLNKKQMTTIIKAGAQLCKQNTNKLKSEKRVSIQYTPVKYVHKTNIAGTVTVETAKVLIV
jgi:predicted ribosome quality control (RQC) complex YloA/Tae2 family protein